MAGLARGFQTGFGLADTVAREDENKRRYEAQQSRLDRQEAESQRRYETQQSRLDKQEARQARADERTEGLYKYQIDDLQHKKERRPIIEAQQDKAFAMDMGTKGLQQQNLQMSIKNQVRNMQMQDIRDAWGVAYQEVTDSGQLTPETYNNLLNTSKGTAFDISDLTNPEYTKAVDFLNTSARDPGAADPAQLLGSFNTVFKNDINKVAVAPGAAYNRITDATPVKGGKIQFEVTAFDSDGQPLKTMKYGKDIPYEKILDGAVSKKSIAAAVIANPKFEGALKYSHQRFGNKTAANTISPRSKYAQRMYTSIEQEYEKNKRSIMKDVIGEKEQQKALAQAQSDRDEKLYAMSSNFNPQELYAAGVTLPQRQPESTGTATNKNAGMAGLMSYLQKQGLDTSKLGQ